jgi:hypothetical protein
MALPCACRAPTPLHRTDVPSVCSELSTKLCAPSLPTHPCRQSSGLRPIPRPHSSTTAAHAALVSFSRCSNSYTIPIQTTVASTSLGVSASLTPTPPLLTSLCRGPLPVFSLVTHQTTRGTAASIATQLCADLSACVLRRAHIPLHHSRSTIPSIL